MLWSELNVFIKDYMVDWLQVAQQSVTIISYILGYQTLIIHTVVWFQKVVKPGWRMYIKLVEDLATMNRDNYDWQHHLIWFSVF